MKKKRLIAAAVCAIGIMNMSACGKNPDSSIVKNKDFDKMIEKAKDSEGETKEIGDIAPDYDTYKTSLADESLGVTVKADAKVDIPDVDKMSIIRVKTKTISQEFLDRALEVFAGDEKLYDGSVTDVRTRREMEEEIRRVKQSQKEDEANGVFREDYEKALNRLQEEYEKSPVDIDWNNFESDKMIHSVKEMSDKMNNTFYDWAMDENPDGEVFYGVNKGDTGEYISLYAQNCEGFGNCLRFGKSRHGHLWNMQVYAPFESIPAIEKTPREDANIWNAGSDVPLVKRSMLGGNLSEYKDETVTISGDEAKKKADECIADMGIEDFKICGSGLYSEVPGFVENKYGNPEVSSFSKDRNFVDLGYCTYYLFRYAREVEGTLVSLEGDDKYTDGWVNNLHVKKIWPKEYIDVKVNDNGVIEFIYNGPLEKVETVVDKSNMQPFDEIKNTFEKMVIAANAQYDLQGEIEIYIDRVTLSYALISEKDNFDTGLLVPVWDFIGTKKRKAGGEITDKNYTTVMCINAIDGTVIDRSLGY